MSQPELPFAAIVHRPDHEPVILGFAYEHQAHHAALSLTADLVNTAHIDGTTITFAPTPAGVCPQAPTPTDAATLACLISSDHHTTPVSHRFPDLFSRLKAQEGYEAASRIWSTACSTLDSGLSGCATDPAP